MYKRIIVMDSGLYTHKAIFAFWSNLKDMSRWFETAPVTFLRMLFGDLNQVKFSPDNDLIILACDSGRSWRKDLDPNYKRRRATKRVEVENKDCWDVIYPDMNEVVDMLDNSTPIQVIKILSREADDIAATVCKMYVNKKELVLITTDEDWQMLAYYNAKVFSPSKKKYYEIKDPLKILDKKKKGDKSDDLDVVPLTEKDKEIRNKVVNLINLPIEIEQPIIDALNNIKPKSIHLSKFNAPPGVQKTLVKLFNL